MNNYKPILCIRDLANYNSGISVGTEEELVGLENVRNWVTDSEQGGGDSLGDNGQLGEP